MAKGFDFRATRSNIRIHACVIMPDHAHLVITNDGRRIEMISNQLKGAATRQLSSDGLHPLEPYKDKQGRIPSPWATGQWKVFITNEEQLHNTIRYVELNPIKAGLKPQTWKFVTPPQ
ncbi:MAG: transposase [Planctomycetota bacterium]